MGIDRLIEIGLSALTLTTCYLAGSKHRFTPIIGGFTELCWLGFTIYVGLYGLLLMNITLVVLYVRMWYKWQRTLD